jgi:APA family basic amino acid/polyamine antiporter
MGAVHSRFRTPYIAIALQAVWSSILVATGTYRELFSRVIYTEWIFFALMTGGLIRMRRRSGYAPAFRAWGYPLVPLLFIAAALAIAGHQIVADPWRASVGLLLVMLGLPLYYVWVRKNARY